MLGGGEMVEGLHPFHRLLRRRRLADIAVDDLDAGLFQLVMAGLFVGVVDLGEDARGLAALRAIQRQTGADETGAASDQGGHIAVQSTNRRVRDLRNRALRPRSSLAFTAGLMAMKGPMARTSRWPILKARIASSGVQTIGSS